MLQETTLPAVNDELSELPYNDLIAMISNAFKGLVKSPTSLVIYETDVDAETLWNLYLDYYPADQRQSFTCNACKHFFKRAAGLVYINPTTFETKTAIWHTVPVEFQTLADQIIALVEKAKIIEPFSHTVHSSPMLGTVNAGGYNHLHVKTSFIGGPKIVAREYATVAKLKESYDLAIRSLGLIAPERITKVLETFKLDAELVNYPKIISVLESYSDFRTTLQKNHVIRHNQVWNFAVARPDAAAIANTAVGEYIASFDNPTVAKRTFLKMVDPINYQRPKALPSEGNVAVAEKLIADLGVARSLERRSASVDDIVFWRWKPGVQHIEAVTGSIFAGLKTKTSEAEASTQVIQGGTKSWTVFERDILPSVVSLQIYVGSHDNFVGINTAVHSDAPPILRYDLPEARNPVSKWVIHGGSERSRWGLKEGYKDVLGIIEGHGNDQLNFVFNCNKVPEVGLCLFPEVLIRELYPIRSTIEQYSKETGLKHIDNPVVGLNTFPARVKVKTKTGTEVFYIIDRFE